MRIDTTLEAFREDYDWREVLSYAGKDACQQGGQGEPEAVPPGSTVSTAPFGMDDVAELLAESEGENDDRDWVCVLRLHDGRFARVEAGCDYTGWD